MDEMHWRVTHCNGKTQEQSQGEACCKGWQAQDEHEAECEGWTLLLVCYAREKKIGRDVAFSLYVST